MPLGIGVFLGLFRLGTHHAASKAIALAVHPEDLGVLEEGAALFGGVRFGEVLHEIEAGADERPVAVADGADRDRRRGVGFADPRWTDQENPMMLGDEASGRELTEPGAWELRV